MRIAIVEDEAGYTEQLRDYLRKYQTEFDRRLEVTSYDSGISFIHNFKGQFDIILLDVAMPYIDGFETARKIREQDTEVVLLFVTNQAQHAIRGYEGASRIPSGGSSIFCWRRYSRWCMGSTGWWPPG